MWFPYGRWHLMYSNLACFSAVHLDFQENNIFLPSKIALSNEFSPSSLISSFALLSCTKIGTWCRLANHWIQQGSTRELYIISSFCKYFQTVFLNLLEPLHKVWGNINLPSQWKKNLSSWILSSWKLQVYPLNYPNVIFCMY